MSGTSGRGVLLQAAALGWAPDAGCRRLGVGNWCLEFPGGRTASSIGSRQNPYPLMPQIQWLVRDALGNQSLVPFRAANFMVFNLPPLGCSPEFLTRFARPWAAYSSSQRASQSHHRRAASQLWGLRPEAYLRRHGRNGFRTDQKLAAGLETTMIREFPVERREWSVACSRPKHYVSWGGIHTTEAFSKAAIHSVLSSSLKRSLGAASTLASFEAFL
ncbi:hypothetical protein SELMODRAFT_423135 [Selaginella moellendorffii]|uniref:Uncharacterized protein n=1 Tax=Selaginella moellendorffii TaxID=88036 RepID=D8SKP1_SELML|nr:hypothetical protein SELMODRAFT_423135 [Selaginella moellendorffii]